MSNIDNEMHEYATEASLGKDKSGTKADWYTPAVSLEDGFFGKRKRR